MAGNVGFSRDRREEQEEPMRITADPVQGSEQPALPDIIPYPAQDPETPYVVYNVRNFSNRMGRKE